MEGSLRRGSGAPGLRLIETLGWDGVQFARLDLHLARKTLAQVNTDLVREDVSEVLSMLRKPAER